MSGAVVNRKIQWITSDPHFGHDKLAELRGFSSVDAHDNYIIRQWMKRVRPEHNVIIAGDISSGSSSAQLRALEIFRQLPGNYLFVLVS